MTSSINASSAKLKISGCTIRGRSAFQKLVLSSFCIGQWADYLANSLSCCYLQQNLPVVERIPGNVIPSSRTDLASGF
jgi:hypothetical protein